MLGIIVVILLLFSSTGEAAIITAASTTQADVESAVSACVTAGGGTVVIPSGTETWAKPLIIDTNAVGGIILQGAGTGLSGTTIVGGIFAATGVTTALIKYYPNTTPKWNPYPFRVTNMTLDCAGDTQGIYAYNIKLASWDNFRLDHLRLLNGISATYPILSLQGHIWGLMDNCEISGGSPHMDILGIQSTSWDSLPTFVFGTRSSFYMEDNTWNGWAYGQGAFHSCGWGGSYSIRYSSYTYNSTSDYSPIWDVHGNQTLGVYSSRGVEIYGNSVTVTQNAAGNVAGLRGGKSVVWNNSVITTNAVTCVSAWEEYDDSLSPTTASQPQHVSDSYLWNNVRTGGIPLTLFINNTWPNNSGEYNIAENVDIFMYAKPGYIPYVYPHPLRTEYWTVEPHKVRSIR